MQSYAPWEVTGRLGRGRAGVCQVGDDARGGDCEKRHEQGQRALERRTGPPNRCFHADSSADLLPDFPELGRTRIGVGSSIAMDS